MTQQIDKVLQKAVESGTAPNVVGIVGDANGVRYLGAAGTLGPGASQAVDGDTVYRLMSMTKMVVTTAALQLMEQGKLRLDAPVAEYYPAFANRKVLTGMSGGKPQLRDPKKQATVKNLITHTAGHGYSFFDSMLFDWEKESGYPGILSGQEEMLDSPLMFDPGERFEYGISTDVLGKVIANITGKTLDRHLQEAILQPLGMKNTSYHKRDVDASKITPIQAKGLGGKWVDTGVDYAQNPSFVPGGHGLYSTPTDYLRFECALLRGGELGGARILKKETVDAAFSNQIGALEFPAAIPSADPTLSHDFNAGPGWKWGYGLLLNQVDVPGMRKAWSGAWAGLCNTHFWIDRTTGICGGIYSQTLPFAEPSLLQMYVDFEQAVYAALT